MPENYSGNTFREPPLLEPDDEEEQLEQPTESTEETAPVSLPTDSAPAQKLHLGSLFGGKGGIGTEELLILALVLLLFDGESNDDLVLFLILLLFIK